MTTNTQPERPMSAVEKVFVALAMQEGASEEIAQMLLPSYLRAKKSGYDEGFAAAMKQAAPSEGLREALEKVKAKLDADSLYLDANGKKQPNRWTIAALNAARGIEAALAQHPAQPQAAPQVADDDVDWTKVDVRPGAVISKATPTVSQLGREAKPYHCTKCSTDLVDKYEPCKCNRSQPAVTTQPPVG